MLSLHTNRVSLMHSVVYIVYVERYVQTINIPFDTSASEVFSRPSTQILNLSYGVIRGTFLQLESRKITKNYNGYKQLQIVTNAYKNEIVILCGFFVRFRDFL